MGFVGILLLIVLALFVIMIKFVINGIRDKNWKKAIFSIIIFIGIILLMYFGLIEFITSM